MAGIVSELRRALGDEARVLHCEERENPLYEGENVVGRSLDGHVNGTFTDGRLLGSVPVTVNRYPRRISRRRDLRR